jgi:hypothetical protein
VAGDVQTHVLMPSGIGLPGGFTAAGS